MTPGDGQRTVESAMAPHKPGAPATGPRHPVAGAPGLCASPRWRVGLAVAKELKESTITVFAVIIGDEPPPNEVATITSITGGETFDAGDPEALKTVFKRIDQMKQAKMEKAIGWQGWPLDPAPARPCGSG